VGEQKIMSSQLFSNDESAGCALDWRTQVSEHPVAFSAGALAAGFVVGYGLAGALGGDADDTVPAHAQSQGGHSASTKPQTSYVSGGEDWSQADEPNKPGLIEKFKNTQAFDRLQTELSSLGDRLLNELSRVGQEVLLPALTGKIKELVGADVSATSRGGQTGRA
jgi:hypothetical protein